MGPCTGSEDLSGLEAEAVDITANINPLDKDAAPNMMLLTCLVAVPIFLQSQGGTFAGRH